MTPIAWPVAAVQMYSTADPQENLAVAGRLIGEAAVRGAPIVVLPERWNAIGTADLYPVAAPRRRERRLRHCGRPVRHSSGGPHCLRPVDDRRPVGDRAGPGARRRCRGRGRGHPHASGKGPANPPSLAHRRPDAYAGLDAVAAAGR